MEQALVITLTTSIIIMGISGTITSILLCIDFIKFRRKRRG